MWICFCKMSTLRYWFNSLYILCSWIKNYLHSHLIVLLRWQYNIFLILHLFISIISISHQFSWQWGDYTNQILFYQRYVCLFPSIMEISYQYHSKFQKLLQIFKPARFVSYYWYNKNITSTKDSRHKMLDQILPGGHC